ncbi:MAG: hypothetical protein QOG64_1671 [Acidimicrobiaceae bacterium]|nr:hypothetical protein [Acidimicrobiaceae bacterium]
MSIKGTVGIYFTSTGVGGAPRADLVAAARTVESLGYGAIWYGESSAREALTEAALILSCTESITVGSAVASIYGRDPMTMANGARTLAEAWTDRFLLGIGVSHAHLATQRGQTFGPPTKTLEQYVQRLRQAPWTGGTETPLPPLLIGANGPRMISVASRLADGVITHLVDRDHTARTRASLGQERLLVVLQPVFENGDGDEGADGGEVPEPVSRFMTSRWENPIYRRSLERMELTNDDATTRAVVALGGIDAIGGRVQAHIDAGADHVVLWPLGTGSLGAAAERLSPLAKSVRR